MCDRCGNLLADCSDPDGDWYPQLTVDYAEMALAAANWMLDRKHRGVDDTGGVGEFHDGTRQRWSKTRSSAFPFHYRDGVRVWVSKYDLTPDADWP